MKHSHSSKIPKQSRRLIQEGRRHAKSGDTSITLSMQNTGGRQRKVILEAVKRNKFFQWLLFGLFCLLQLIYCISMVYQISTLVAIMVHNEQILDGDYDIEYVMEYEVHGNGKLSFKLADGTSYENMDTTFAFINNNDIDESYYNEESNVIITEVSKDYEIEFLKGSKYFIVLFSSILMTVGFFLLKSMGWVVLSRRCIRVITSIVTGAVVLSGLLAVLML